MLESVIAGGTLYSLYSRYFMEEVSARLGWAREPCEVTPGRRPVMELAGAPGDQTVLRPLPRSRSASPYERARLTANSLGS